MGGGNIVGSKAEERRENGLSTGIERITLKNSLKTLHFL
jgi:hypothetical protein